MSSSTGVFCQVRRVVTLQIDNVSRAFLPSLTSQFLRSFSHSLSLCCPLNCAQRASASGPPLSASILVPPLLQLRLYANLQFGPITDRLALPPPLVSPLSLVGFLPSLSLRFTEGKLRWARPASIYQPRMKGKGRVRDACEEKAHSEVCFNHDSVWPSGNCICSIIIVAKKPSISSSVSNICVRFISQ